MVIHLTLNDSIETEKTNTGDLEHTKIGLKTCLEHIDKLLKDSEVLMKNKRYSASVGLSILALEEIGKAHFLDVSLSVNKPLSDKIWNEITKGGGAHVKKVTGIIVSKELHLDKDTPEKNQKYTEFCNEVGIRVDDNELLRIENWMTKKVFLRLEKIKQDCFYTNLDAEKKWMTFDNRFNDLGKKAISTYLYVLAVRMHTMHKLTINSPQKSFQEYSKDDKKKLKSLWKEAESVRKKIDTKKNGHLIDLAYIAIVKNYPSDNKRGLVKEKNDSLFESKYDI